MIEKRQHPRKQVDLDAVVVVVGSSDRFEGKVRDLSIGGMFFVGDKVGPFGSKVEVTLRFGGRAGDMTIPAIVRWSGADGFGVQFGLMGAKETHAIVQILTAARQ